MENHIILTVDTRIPLGFGSWVLLFSALFCAVCLFWKQISADDGWWGHLELQGANQKGAGEEEKGVEKEERNQTRVMLETYVPGSLLPPSPCQIF